MSEVLNNGVPGYTTSTAGDYTILTPEDKKASVFQKVTPREQYLVAREVANRAIDEINAIRGNRPSSFTDGINAANIAARRQASETYGATLPGGSRYDGAREAAYDTADAYKSVLDDAAARGRLTSTAPRIARITGDWGYGPSIPYPKESFSDWTTEEEVTDDTTPTDPNPTDPNPTDPNPTDPTPDFETTWEPTENYDGGGYTPGDFGRGPQYAEYEDMFRNSINEGFTLEEAMRNSRTATPQDWENAFGSADDWKKIGGGSKSGSGASRPSSGGINSSGPNRGARSTGGTSRNSHNRGGR